MKLLLKILTTISTIFFICFSNVNASTYFITGDGVRVRSSAENTQYNVIGKLNFGEELNIVKKEGSWYKIKYGNGYGYVTTTFTNDKSKMVSTRVIALVNKSIDLKKSNSTSSKTICRIPKNAVVKVGVQKSNWSLIQYNGDFGYVKTANLNKITNQKETCLGTYTLSYSLNNNARNNNIDKAVTKLNKYTLKPGKTFSFLKTVGTSGYQQAPEFDKNIKILGGGLSQVATSLYQCVRDAQKNGCHISVKEKERYSTKTPYAKTGEEAIIDMKAKTDFTFTNCTNYTIKLYSIVKDDKVSFVISQIK